MEDVYRSGGWRLQPHGRESPYPRESESGMIWTGLVRAEDCDAER
jgi:hypothetical protein